MPQPAIPRIYRVVFAYIDPLLALYCAITAWAFPNHLARLYIPIQHIGLDTLHTAYAQQLGAGYIGTGIKSALLFAVQGADLSVWRAVITGFLVEDCLLMTSLVTSLRDQGRLGLGLMRLEDWWMMELFAFFMAMRASFLLGIGFEKKSSKSRDKRL